MSRLTRSPLAGLFALTLCTFAPGCLKVDESNPPDGTTAEIPDTAQAVLDRYVTAIGGEATLRAMTIRTVEADMTLYLGQECEAGTPGCIPDGSKGKFVLHSTADGRMYRKVIVVDMIDERGFDGETGWQLQPEPARVVLEDPAAVPMLREDALLHWYFDLAAREVEAVLQAPRDTDSSGQVRPLDGLLWRRTAGDLPHRERWFDRSSGLLVEELEIDGEGEQETRRVVTYSDYREVDGTKVPHRIVQAIKQGDNESRLEFDIVAVKHEAVPESMFSVPRLAAPEPTPDPFLAGLEEAQRQADAAPKEATAAVGVARAAWSAARFRRATEAAKHTLTLDAKEPEALWLLTQLALLDGSYDEAERWAKKAASAGVDPRRRDLVLATIALHQRDFDKAAKLFGGAGVTPLADRYGSFKGKPFAIGDRKAPCRTTVPLLPQLPAAIIEVEADGEKVRLLVDTTAPDLIISPQTATRLVITADARTAISEQDSIGHGRIDKFALGSLTIDNVPVDIYPAHAFLELSNGMAIDGILGTRMFQDGVLRIDPTSGRLDFVHGGRSCKADADGLRQGSEVGFWMHQTHSIYVQGYLGASEGLYMFNTGMRGAGLTANDAAFARAGVAPPPLQPGRASFVRIDDFRVGDSVTVRPQRAAYGYMQEQMTGDQFRFDGMIGFEAVADRSFAIDFPARKLYFGTPAQPPTPAPSAEPAGAGQPAATPSQPTTSPATQPDPAAAHQPAKKN